MLVLSRINLYDFSAVCACLSCNVRITKVHIVSDNCILVGGSFINSPCTPWDPMYVSVDIGLLEV